MSATVPHNGPKLSMLRGSQASLDRTIPFLCDISFLLVTISISQIDCGVPMVG